MKKIIKLSASWCEPCKALQNVINSTDLGDVTVENIDIDNDMDIAQLYKIRGVPTLIILEDGIEINRSSGLINKEQLLELVA